MTSTDPEMRRGRPARRCRAGRPRHLGAAGPAGVPVAVGRHAGPEPRHLDADGPAQLVLTEIGGSAALVALVQTAISLPVFLLAMPAGVLADLVDRRRLLLGTHLVMRASPPPWPCRPPAAG